MLKRKNKGLDQETRESPEEENTTPQAKNQGERSKRRLSAEFQLTIILSVIFTIIVSLALSPLMNIDAVAISGNQAVSDKHVAQLAKDPQGKNLFLYKKGEAVRSLESHPYIKEAAIHRHLPHRLSIEVKERRAVGVLVNRGIFLQFSSDGLLLNSTPTLENTTIPIITGISLKAVPQPGGKIKNEAFDQALAVVNAMPKELLGSIQEINIAEKDNILAYTSNGIEVRIGSIKKIDSRMSALNDIMKQVVLSHDVQGKVEYIDMRYSKSPILKLKGQDGSAIPLDIEGADMPISAEREAQRVEGTTEAVAEGDPETTQDENAQT